MKIVTYKNIKLLDKHPGSGSIDQHHQEIARFKRVFNNVTSSEPVMVELGCFWALFSLVFRDNFKNGRNILVEPIYNNLEVGKENFSLNGYECEPYNVGIFFDKITNKTKKHFQSIGIDLENIESIAFSKLYNDLNLDTVDCLHVDIQGSEKFLIDDIYDLLLNGKILNIVIATHSKEIENYIAEKIKTLQDYESTVQSYNSSKGDGEIYIKKILNQ